MNFLYFKTITGVSFVLVLIIAFINLLSFENVNIILREKIKI